MIDLIPYRADKNLGKAYNDVFRSLPGEAVLCLRDYDTLWLTHDYNLHLDEYHRRYPDAVLTCYTNRISPLSTGQLYKQVLNKNPDITTHIRKANELRDRYLVDEKDTWHYYSVSPVNQDISGMVMIIPRTVWQAHPFTEDKLCLGVDTDWNRRIRAAGIKILRMNGLYIWHTYRLLTGIHDKEHLK